MSASIIPRLLFFLALALPVSSRAYAPAPTRFLATTTSRAAITTTFTRDGMNIPKAFVTAVNLQAQRLPRSSDKTYHGNKKTKKFHASSCRYFDCKNCVVVFRSRERAIRAGYTPCKVCRP